MSNTAATGLTRSELRMRVALITGGTRGIGRALVETFTAADYAVAFTYASSAATAGEIESAQRAEGRTVQGFQASAEDMEACGKVFADVEEGMGPVDVLINNAGITRDGPLHRMSPDDWHQVIATNLTGAFYYSQKAVQSMLRRGGVILNITSVSAMIGMPGQTNYSASKAGMIGLTRSLAKEVARFDIRVNAIAPGFIETDMTAALPEAALKKAYAQIPMRKPGDAAGVAKLALYLAGPDAGYITGQVFPIDGGLS